MKKTNLLTMSAIAAFSSMFMLTACDDPNTSMVECEGSDNALKVTAYDDSDVIVVNPDEGNWCWQDSYNRYYYPGSIYQDFDNKLFIFAEDCTADHYPNQ